MGVRRFYLKVFKDLLRLRLSQPARSETRKICDETECAHRKHRSGSHLRLPRVGRLSSCTIPA